MKFTQASNQCKRVLEAERHNYAKTKEFMTFQELGSYDFWQIGTSVFNKTKSATPLLFSCPEVLSSASDKAICLLKTFLGTLMLINQVSFYPL